ncbi:MAG: hypothetical protein KF777_15460 [Planctomycetaceae bacterium]|nr:hypothetical protein [Planctomycetaceae bacterium]
MTISRRQFLGGSIAAMAGVTTRRLSMAAEVEPAFPPVRVITRGPRHHWFGYYDKLQFDPTDRYVLGMQVPFEHRSPVADDVIQIGMVDLEDGDRWIDLGETTAWNWQQGCMLQWLPRTKSTVLWNERGDGNFVCRILDVATGQSRVIPHAIYAVSPDGKTGITTDFRRIADVRPGYGYAGFPDPRGDELAPEKSGIWRVDLESGEATLIVSVAQIAALGEIPNPHPEAKHYFNHLLVSPDGTRFIALHRWRYPDGNRLTRLFTANLDGSDIRIVIPNGYASHFIWRDPRTILSQSRNWLGNANWGDFLFEDVPGGGDVQEIGAGVLDGSGHLTYLPGLEWILNDTYPKGPERLQTPHLYHVASGRRIDLGHFPSPPEYTGEWRVDTHPRLSRNGRMVCIDSPAGKLGRQLHLIDISSIVG